MAITDLADTYWYIPSGWTTPPMEEVFSLNVYYSGSQSGTLYTDQSTFATSICLGYDDNDGTIMIGTSTYTTSYYIYIHIVSGNTTASSLVSWFNSYGIQLDVDDLTDTTWNVPAGWEAEAGYSSGVSFLTGSVNYDGNTIDFRTFSFGNTYDENEGEVVELANNIYVKGDDNVDYDITPSSSFTVTFNGGNNVTSAKQIAWLSKYGELQGVEEEPEQPTLTYDLSQLNLPEGTHSITVVAKADGYSNSAPSNAVEYVVEASLPVWNGTDLTGTTWEVASGWSATSGLGKFNIDWSSETAGSGSIFAVGYNIESFTTYVTEANKITFGSGVPLLAIGNTNEFTVTFTGGTDVTNSSLISWLKQYGTLTSHTMAPSPTPV